MSIAVAVGENKSVVVKIPGRHSLSIKAKTVQLVTP
jgi:hypothetical protein